MSIEPALVSLEPALARLSHDGCLALALRFVGACSAFARRSVLAQRWLSADSALARRLLGARFAPARPQKIVKEPWLWILDGTAATFPSSFSFSFVWVVLATVLQSTGERSEPKRWRIRD